MLTESTINKIHLLYKKYLNDITSFTDDDLKLLMNYFSEHPLFNEILKTKGFNIFKKILTNIRLKRCEKHDSIVKFDSNKNVFNLFLFGNIKKRNVFKGIPKEIMKKDSEKYLYCIYHCLSDTLFAEIDRHVYMKYLISSGSDLYNKFVEKISKFSFFSNLHDYQYNNLFLKYVEKKYGPHEIIYEEGDKIDGVYLIMKGKCLVSKKKMNNLSLDNSNNTNTNFSTISNNDMFKKKKGENNIRLFHPLFAKINKNNNILLTMNVGDIFGDLEINLNNNKREFTVKSGNFNKTKVWFFPLYIIKNIINNYMDLSTQKYDIIKTRFEYVNLVDKVKKENTINKIELKIDDIINNSKNMNSNFKSFQQKFNLCALKSSTNNIKTEKKYKNTNLLSNITLMASRNRLLKRSSKYINKSNFSRQSRPKIKILFSKSQNEKNIISIAKENNFLKKVNNNIISMKSIETPKILNSNDLNRIEQNLFLQKFNKKNNNFLLKLSNNETF